MKKVGIITMHRIANYGSFLQSYGLKKMVESLGYDVEFVDYEFEKSIVSSDQKAKKLFDKFKKAIHLKRTFKIRKEWNYFQKKYKEFLEKYYNVTDNKNLNVKNLDNLIIGSDEVFNCMQEYPVGYSRELFGKNYEKVNTISYAASFGYTTYEKLVEHKIKDEIKEMLSRFSAISVRDKNSEEIINKVVGNMPYMHLDPVLVSNFEYEQKKVEYKDYIIVYTYPGRLSSKEEKYIKDFAKKHNKKILSIGFYQSIADINIYVDPLDVFNYFKNADYVITDTFHGTIFSIKTNAKFCTIIRNSNKNKLRDLLSKLNQSSRCVNELEDIEKLFSKEMIYQKTNDIICEESKKSIEYLKNELK